jgi:uncharacterized membrane protein YqaE (UPF0057 family)
MGHKCNIVLPEDGTISDKHAEENVLINICILLCGHFAGVLTT